MQRKRKKRGLNIDRRLLILFSIIPVGCLVAMALGLVVTWFLLPTRFVDAQISDFSEDEAQEYVIMVAADYAEYQDIERAREALTQLQVPNKSQYVAMVAERMIRTNRGPVDQEIQEVVDLADALGVSTISMISYVSSPTSTPTQTPLPTPTSTNTPVVPTDTPTPVVEAAAESAEAEESEEVPAEEAVSEEPPTETPIPEPEATDTPVPPTNTPEPTPAPTSEFDFSITKLRLLSQAENGGCMGNHNIFVTVVDAAGSPIKGVILGDIWDNPGPTTGHKGDDKPGYAEFDIYKNSGLHIMVKSDPTAGRPVSSESSELLSSDDWEIGIPRLMEAGYCPDEGTCRVLWNSGVAGEGNNSLCWGHYSWEVTFQRAW